MEKYYSKLTPSQCLALRVDTLQSKTQYKAQYNYLKKNVRNPLQSPSVIDDLELLYAPSSTRYSIQGLEFTDNYYHTPAKVVNRTEYTCKDSSFEPPDVLQDFQPVMPEFASPNIKGVRWSYPDAIASTLKELEPKIVSGLKQNKIDPNDPNILLITSIKDGADGLGDVSIHKELSDRFLPDKAFRFSFCVFKIEAVVSNREPVEIFVEENPNSVRTNRPLLEAICDENNRASSLVCLLPIENERAFLKDKILRVQHKDGWRRHCLKFYTSMIDEKLDRKESGLAGSGSRYLCTLCEATTQSAVKDLGSFQISRTYSETKEIAEYIRVNPDRLSQSAIDNISKGVKRTPTLQAEAIEKCLDSTHADINLGSFFKKLLTREIATVTQWEATADVKPILKDAEVKFDMHLKKNIGINPELMMPGNYARVLFNEANESKILSYLPNEDRRKNMSSVLQKFRFMRKVYRSKDPKKECPEDISKYKETAVEMAKLLLTHFGYASWPNYLHKVVEHVQEIIESQNGPGTVGGISGEGNECGNKIFRHMRKNLARKGNTQGGLRDVLWCHWLYSSPELSELATLTLKQARCSLCFELGHNRRTCVMNKSSMTSQDTQA
ncbi:V(D)J recombination-activating protein 1-like [Mercenaria mercenaria]|uniref:V(D)J recombination-activating protein 1-like n=1 Tax=Mercenaria mercenaria TaxID=6596 RepID=UPI00234F0125|nr:V(D)J recombination-activating protein 1-like [Mercenaria mercenaria]